MARIVISTIGTLGDVVPFIGLSQRLQERGHDVVLAVHSAMHPLIRQAGLPVVPCGPPFGPEEARCSPGVPEGTSQPAPELKKWESLLRDVPAKYQDLYDACQGADLLVAHSFHYAALLVHDQLKVPWICVSLLPGQFQHYEYRPSAQPAPRADLNLLASSQCFSAVDANINSHLAVTGFWFQDNAEPDSWHPTAAQRDFVEGGDKPLVLCLGCLPGPNASEVVDVHVRAAARLGKKLVIQIGWLDPPNVRPPSELNLEHVLLVPFLSHEWLFAHAGAIIHHGGISLTARALRHGCPMLVIPQRRDQLFHAARIRALGVGAGMHPLKLTADGVARMLSERVCVPETIRQAQALGKAIGAEDGLAAACDAIEGQLGAA
jgi:UDP:flavonoid glycosyltransferase YjiC (YdhE family)